MQLPPPVTMLALDQRAAPAVPTFCLLMSGAYQNSQSVVFSEVKARSQDLSLSTFLWLGECQTYEQGHCVHHRL